MLRQAIFILLLLTSGLLKGQDDLIRTIVLINGLPFMVDVTAEGDITEIYQNVPEYFSSRTDHNSLVQKYSNNPEPQVTSIVFFEKEEEPIPSFTEENKRPIEYGNNQYIGFSPDRALLLKNAVDQIRRIADGYRNNEIGAISVTSYHRASYRSRALARNRAKAIKDLLGAFGMPASLIQTRTTVITPGSKVDFVQVAFSE